MPKIPKDCKWKSTGRTLGSGGQGDVELVVARDGEDERVYALKKLRNTSSPQARQRFAKEVAALQSIDSPVIARVVDFADTADDFQYYVMEYFEGAESLSKIIYSDSNPLHGNALESLGLVDRVAEGVAVYESKSPRIVHRDIKPDNILLLPDGSVRLIDFGICQVDESGVLTLVDENVGARNFGAPECEAGNDAAIDIRADLYSVGKVLWSVMTSRRAFARETPAFSNRSFRAEFPTQPETWHLTSVLAAQFDGSQRTDSETQPTYASHCRRHDV